jgi:hypothetical protein
MADGDRGESRPVFGGVDGHAVVVAICDQQKRPVWRDGEAGRYLAGREASAGLSVPVSSTCTWALYQSAT